MVARIAVGDIEEEYVERREPTPNRRKGEKKGGKAKAEALTPDQRPEIAKRAANVRWGTQIHGPAVA